MPVAGLLKPNTYRDSVALMVLSSALAEADGVRQASAMMATPANLEILRATGLFDLAFDAAGPNDVCIAVEARDDAAAREALAVAERLLTAAGGVSGAGPAGGNEAAWRPRTLRSAVRARSDANVALISVPGAYAALEARQALLAGLNVFLFSDNVPLADEIELKQLGSQKGLLVMGPDCGTALIGGAPLGFANAVRRGGIGVVGSSGTGLQEVTSLIHRLGEGVSHAIGTGGRDLYAEVGGLSFLAAVDALAADPGTRVLVGIAKPGDPTVERTVLARLRASGKPAVVYFLGGEALTPQPPLPRKGEGESTRASVVLPSPSQGRGAGGEGLLEAADLEHAARCAVALARGEEVPPPRDATDLESMACEIVAGLAPGQVAVRGLFAGGTLAQEAATAISRALGRRGGSLAGEKPGNAVGGGRPGEVLRLGPHSVLDLGDDAYTRGRPHPLIDPRLRNAELVAQAGTGQVALFLIDVILGTGSHPDPAGAFRPALDAARTAAEAEGARLEVLASLCGTEDDAQGYERQRAMLESQGVRVATSSSAAASIAGQVAALLAESGR